MPRAWKVKRQVFRINAPRFLPICRAFPATAGHFCFLFLSSFFSRKVRSRKFLAADAVCIRQCQPAISMAGVKASAVLGVPLGTRPQRSGVAYLQARFHSQPLHQPLKRLATIVTPLWGSVLRLLKLGAVSGWSHSRTPPALSCVCLVFMNSVCSLYAKTCVRCVRNRCSEGCFEP